MHVAVDLRILDRDGMERSGIGRYALEAARALRAARPDWRFSLHSNRRDLFEAGPGDAIHRTGWPTRFALGRVAWGNLAAGASRGPEPDVWWGPAFTLPPRWRGPAVVTIHDLVFRMLPELYRSRVRAAYASRATAASVRRADRVLCPSATTAERLVSELGVERERIVAAPWGINELFRGAGEERREDFVLFVGRWEARKGLETLHGAVRDVVAGGRPLRLVVAGGPGWGASGEVRSLRDDPRVELVFDPGDERLASLYARALALAYPSRMEGFGFPVAEAMAGGCPVVASDLPELRELAQDAAAYFAPGDRRGLAGALTTLIDDPERRQTMAARGRELAAALTWEACGEVTAGALEAAVARSSG